MDFINILKVIFLGIVEGITEWLPISSTGHLILFDEFIKLDASADFMKMFNVVIQLGAILAVVVIYFSKLNPFSPSKTEPVDCPANAVLTMLLTSSTFNPNCESASLL